MVSARKVKIKSRADAIDIDLRRCDGDDLDRWAQVLTPDECVRAGRFRQPDDRRRYIVGRGVLRTMLGRRLDRAPASLAFGANPHDKPTLDDAADIAFNVSHSGDYVLVAVGRAQAIGVDVEQWRPDLDLVGLGRQVFTSTEQASIAKAPAAQQTFRFFRQWTFKEAVVKAVGLGLSLDLKRFEITFEDGTAHLVSHGAPELGAAKDWRLEEIKMEAGYCAALAVLPWARGG